MTTLVWDIMSIPNFMNAISWTDVFRYKRPHGFKDKLIIIWWPKFKVTEMLLALTQEFTG